MSQIEAHIQSWIQTGVGVITAMGVLYSIHQGMRTRRAAHQAVAVIQTVSENVDRVEKATNSMMASAQKLALEKADADTARAKEVGIAIGKAAASDNT